MAGKVVSALYGVKPGNAKALSAAVTAKAWASEAPARASMAAGVASRVAHMGAGSSAGAAAPKLSAASPSPSTHAPASSGSGRKMTFSGLAGQQGRAQPDAHVTAETRHGHPGHYVHFKGDDGKPAQIYSQTKAGADAVRDILAKGRSGGYDVKAISSALLTAPTGSGSAGAPGSKAAPRSSARNAALLNKLQDRTGRAMMKNDPSYEQKRSRFLAVKAALPAEHVATAESARAAKNAASVVSVKATMRGKGGGSGMRQLVKELDAAKRVEAGQPAAVKAPKVAKAKPEPVARVSKPPVHEARRNAPMTEENRLDGGTLKPRIASATTVKETMDQWHDAANRTTKKEAMSEVKSLTPHSPNPPVAMKSMARQYGDDALVATRDARIAKAHAQHQDGIAASLTAKGDHAGARQAAEAASGHRVEMNKAMDMAASKRRTASSYRRDYAKVSAGLSEGAKTVFRIDHDTQAMYRNGASQRTPIKPIPRAQ